MTVATINDTITTIVASELGVSAVSSYSATIAKVSEALTEREYAVVEAIVELAAGYAAKEDVENILTQAGLAVRPVPVVEPEAEDEAVTADDVEAGKPSKAKRLAALEENQSAILSSLTALGQTVNALKVLAERHLGSSL